jgi:hypothetical protein
LDKRPTLRQHPVMTREERAELGFWYRLQKGQIAELAFERIAKAHGYAVEYNGQQYHKPVCATRPAKQQKLLPDFILYPCANWNTATGHDNQPIAPPARGKKHWHDCEHWSRCWNFSGSIAANKWPPFRKPCSHFCYRQGTKTASAITVEVKWTIKPETIERLKRKTARYYQEKKYTADHTILFTIGEAWDYNKKNGTWHPLAHPDTGLGLRQQNLEHILKHLKNFQRLLETAERNSREPRQRKKTTQQKKPNTNPNPPKPNKTNGTNQPPKNLHSDT